MQTLVQMAEEVNRLHNNRGTAFVQMLKDRLKKRYNQLVKSHNWKELLFTTTVLAPVDRGEFGLPQEIDQVIAPWDKDQDYSLQVLAVINMARRNASIMDVSGVPYEYSMLGTYPVHTQPSAALNVGFGLQRAGQGGGVRIVGYDSTGHKIESNLDVASVATPGVGASFVADDLYERVSTIARDIVGTSHAPMGIYEYDGVGSTTLAASYTELGIIAAGDATVQYSWMKLGRPAAVATTFDVFAKRRVTDLLEDLDVPAFDCSDALQQGAFADGLLALQQHDSARTAEGRWAELVDNLWQEQVQEPQEQSIYPSKAFVDAAIREHGYLSDR